ncbi:Transient receptor potential (TRP) ion channel domain containing protein [Amanita muscaria]
MSALLILHRSFIPLFLLLILPRVFAGPATVYFSDCFDQSANVTQKLNISTIYAQILQSDVWDHYLNLTLLGENPQGIINFANTSSSLSTLFTTTSVLTLTAFSNTSALCSTIRPPSPLPSPSNATNYCPLSPGPFAFSVTIPLGERRELTTLSTRLRAVDPFTNELFCVDIPTTPLEPALGSPYGEAKSIFWVTVALTLGYWAVVGVARIVSAWGRGIADKGLWARARSGGFILASAISGERLAGSPALMRFCTPSMRDILFHTQWCSALAMVAVEWPPFVYPILSQTAWSTLIYNVTLSSGSDHRRWNPLSTLPFSPPQNFADQLADPSSPLFVDVSAPNLLFTLPNNATNGISSFAYTVGIHAEDLFANCLIIFLGVIAATIVISTIVWCIDHAANLIFGSNNVSPYPGLHTVATSRTPVAKEDTTDLAIPSEETKSQNGHLANLFRPSSRFNLSTISSTGDRGTSTYRSWWRFRSDINSFHGSVLHGNLVRILVLFHLPVTIFSCYHMTLPHSQASMGSIVLAALSFVFFSILIPVHLVLRVTFTSTNKLYDETRTLLNYGALYNHYRHGSQMFASLLFATNIVFGVTIGTGQKSGTAQAIIILVVEVISALVTSIWLPWGSGASMGLISFLFCVARIIMAVMLVILTPTISVGSGAAGWVAYGILLIMALVFLALTLMLLVKLLEGLIRILARIGFDRSRHVTDSGLFGVMGFLGCCGLSSGGRKHQGTRDRRGRQQVNNSHRGSTSSDLPPLNRHTTFDSARSDIVHPPYLTSASRKASMNSGPPPSVLRPEHALLPYREDKDSDDEGFIMGAWRPFGSQRTGYSPVSDTGRSSTSSKQPSTGFSRVGGGRSHIDSPYSINHGGRGQSGSTHTFPSHSTTGPGRSGLSNPISYDDDTSPPPSFYNVSNIPVGGVAAGESQPLHTRTKSHTAIVEDAGWLSPSIAESGLSSSPLPPSSGATAVADFFRPRLSSIAAVMIGSGSNNTSPSHSKTPTSSAGAALSPDMDGNTPDNQQHKKGPWQFLKRRRAQSNEESASPPLVDSEFGGLDPSSPQPGRSFVVIRKNQGGARAPSSSSEPSGSKAGTTKF